MRWFSDLRKSAPVQIERGDDARSSQAQKELPAFTVDQHDSAERHREVHDRKQDIAQMRGKVGQTALQENIGVEGDHGIDAVA